MPVGSAVGGRISHPGYLSPSMAVLGVDPHRASTTTRIELPYFLFRVRSGTKDGDGSGGITTDGMLIGGTVIGGSPGTVIGRIVIGGTLIGGIAICGCGPGVVPRLGQVPFQWLGPTWV